MSTAKSLEYGLQTFRRLGLSDEAFYGAAGSLMGESGRQLDTGAHNPNDPNGGSNGIAQWHSDRWWDFQAAVATPEWGRGRTERDYTAQWDWIAHELQTTEKATLERLRSADSRDEAAVIWTDSYERPAPAYAHHDKRIENATYAAEVVSGRIQPDRDGTRSLTGANNNFTVSSSGTEGINPMTNPMDFLLGLGNTVTGGAFGSGASGSGQGASPNNSGIPEPRGPINATQALTMAMGNYVHGDQGAQFAAQLFGAGNEPKKLSLTEGITMGIGGYLGGIPGAVLGQALGRSISGLFDGDGNPWTLKGENTFGFGNDNEGGGGGSGVGANLLRGVSNFGKGLFDGDGDWLTLQGKSTVGGRANPTYTSGGSDREPVAKTSTSAAASGSKSSSSKTSTGGGAKR